MEGYRNIGLTLAITTGLILLAAKMNGEKILSKNFLAVGILAVACLLIPFPAMLLAIPVALLAYFRYQADIWELWYRLKDQQLN